MFTKINETIAVVGTYNHSSFKPRKFLWRDRVFPIQKITFITETRDGANKLRIYSIESQGSIYRILFNRETEEWQVSEIFCE